MISVRILAPDIVEVTVRPSWWERLLFGTRNRDELARRIDGRWCFDRPFEATEVDDRTLVAIAIALLEDAIGRADDAARRRAETARNYQAAAQRGEYPIR